MNYDVIKSLMKIVKSVFIDEATTRVEDIEKLFSTSMDKWTQLEAKKIANFFTEIKNSASILGFDYLSLICEGWEKRLRDFIKNGQVPDGDTLKEAYLAVNIIKAEISRMRIKAKEEHGPIRLKEYINMPNRGKVLLVDNDIATLKLLDRALTIEGYKIYVCDNPLQTMDMIDEVMPDIILMDIMMPELEGYEILEKLKLDSKYLDIHIIILSFIDNLKSRGEAIKLIVDDYISKPFIINDVVNRVEKLMRTSSKYREKLLKDSLTDAYSRYYFNLRMVEELERYRRYGPIFTIVFIDMDNYNYINERHGHQVGDRVLGEFVDYVIKNIRKCDSIFRYGGEEFILLLPETTEENAYILMERLRFGFSSRAISIGDTSLYVTFSAGIKQVNGQTESIEQITDNAAKAMYYAKKSGKNQVYIHNEEITLHDLNKTLLVVDYESIILKCIRERFSNIGHYIVTARDTGTAFKLIKEIHPDVILIDTTVADAENYDLLRTIKQDPLTQSIKVVLLIKKEEANNVLTKTQFVADDYVAKNLSMEELEARIMRVLNNSSENISPAIRSFYLAME